MRQVRISLEHYRERGGLKLGKQWQNVNSRDDLGTKTVERSAGPLQGINDIQSSDGLALSMLGVGN